MSFRKDDVHFPTLAVEATLKFAAASRTGHERVSEFPTRNEEVSYFTESLATVFGLRHTMKTVVGDASVRGEHPSLS